MHAWTRVTLEFDDSRWWCVVQAIVDWDGFGASLSQAPWVMLLFLPLSGCWQRVSLLREEEERLQ